MLAGVLLHEAGHLLAASLTGGRILDIKLLSASPHVDISTSASRAVEAFRAASGTGFVVLLWLAILMRRGIRETTAAEALNWFAVIDLIGWILCIFFPDGSPNDASYFLLTSQLPSRDLLLVLLALALTVAIPLCKPFRASLATQS